MPLINIGPLKLETVLHGDPASPAMLLIQGLGTPLTRWPTSLIERLTAAGFYVICFDNRDIGLSSQMNRLGLPSLKSLIRGQPFAPLLLPALSAVPPLPYTLADMAADALALLDALGIAAAHIVGASMGGMIAQLIAALSPARCLSLTSIMSSSGNPLLPPPTPAALKALFSPLPRTRDEAVLVADSVWRQQVLMSPAYPTPEAELTALFTAEIRRGFHPAGVVRQLAALLAGGDRRPLLTLIRAPAVVLHGTDDPLIPAACGRDTAASIPHAELRLIPGMGHDFPKALAPEFAEAILTAARRARPVD
jgi:pimeloyl-ACP methyl ester carboxylesterase